MRVIRPILSDIASILLAIVLAIVIWASAVQEANPIGEKEFTLSVERIERADAILLNNPQPTVLVTVRAPENTLERLSPADCSAFIDLESAGFSVEEVPIQVECAESFGFTDADIEIFPNTTIVQMDQFVQVDIPIRIIQQDSVPLTYELIGVTANPVTVTVSGPSTDINVLSEARANVFLGNIRASQTVGQRLTFYDKQGNVRNVTSPNISLSSQSTAITIDVAKRNDLKSVTIQPITTGRLAPGYRFLGSAVKPSNILISGQPDVLEKYTFIRTEPVDISGLTESEIVPIGLVLPDDVEWVDPETILMTIDVAERITEDIFSAEPNISGLAAGLTATLNVETIEVVLSGPQLAIEAIDRSDLRVDLDLFGFPSGTHEIRPLVTVPIESIVIGDIIPPTILVEITTAVTETITPTLEESGSLLIPTVQQTQPALKLVPSASVAIALAASFRRHAVF